MDAREAKPSSGQGKHAFESGHIKINFNYIINEVKVKVKVQYTLKSLFMLVIVEEIINI